MSTSTVQFRKPCKTSCILVIVMLWLVTCGCDRESRIERLAPKKNVADLADNKTNLSRPIKSEPQRRDPTDSESGSVETSESDSAGATEDSSGNLDSQNVTKELTEPQLQRVNSDRFFPGKYNNKRKTLIFLAADVEYRTHYLITVFRDLMTDGQLAHAEEVVSRLDQELERLFLKRQKIVAWAKGEAKADEEILHIYKRTINISRELREQIINEVLTVRQRETHLKRVKVQKAIREQSK